ncbi:caspase family protein [Qipengyuania qiaonensis]|uniref:Caspase family protein n=1 Tax=Qipengyuania qiaonensis TaxID=2867240 RepID=A0ABS7J620_9SPHN|nr:caspase family protein [Qipengyuania qiaonensis]MBX7482783.1 caspase family protein [Qipengyuania qiaonensis]
MRRALVVGIDHYQYISPLFGAVNDAHSIKTMLDRHTDGSINFQTNLLVGTDQKNLLTRHQTKEAIRELFAGKGEVAFLYFAGHGYIEATGGYLCAGDCKTGDDGVSLSEILILANKSKFLNRVIVLDSCHSGIAGDHPAQPAMTEIADGVTILTASTAEQYAQEENGQGIFTNLMVDALGGAAANLVGDVTPGGVYAHVDQSLGTWGQRPVFKTNVERFISLRKVKPQVHVEHLRRISEFFPEPGFEFALDPSFEPERPEFKSADAPNLPAPCPEKNAVFAILQDFNRVGLLVPDGAPHMWHAAMQSKSVRLTALGEHYRRLASKGLI